MRMEPAGELVVEEVDTAWVVTLRGEHDVSTTPRLEAEIDALFARGTNVVVDLSEATFIDSSVAGALMRGWQTAAQKPDSTLVVCAPVGSAPRRLLDMIGLGRMVPVLASRADGIAHVCA